MLNWISFEITGNGTWIICIFITTENEDFQFTLMEGNLYSWNGKSERNNISNLLFSL